MLEGLKMKLLARTGIALTLLAFTAGSAMAGAVSNSPGPAKAPHNPPSVNYGYTADRQIWMQEVNRQALMPTKARWERARRAAALVNADRCMEAYKLAVAEKDNKLAEGVVRACSARTS